MLVKNLYLKFILSLFFVNSITNETIQAQDDYKITYAITSIKSQKDINEASDRIKSFYKQVVEYTRNINYTLVVNKKESYFENSDFLTNTNNTPLDDILKKSALRFPNFNENVYVNYLDDYIVFTKKLLGKDFTIKQVPCNFNWDIKKDTRKILGLNVKKAEGFYFNPVLKEKIKVIAWFAPSIPLQSGPDIFMGLPGLIMEVDLKGAIVTVKKIEQIKSGQIKPEKTKNILTQEEYEKQIKALNKKFLDE
ncbi:GLPGLI family protein [Mesonia hippocampi]|uniref:GLPGLI family protein n=1 Tax=Mesonia hippocampi TaxID=1628250 RepID=A0A840EGS6_9FLAO|nr:GLPGLI family protein [Mesonia hippocampi]MBB4118472.1 GLPGLI family protein [Mesonia hippocampi]